jgi:hypothetical protein
MDALLKELYPAGLPEEIMMRNHPFMTMVPKSGEAYGEYIVVPVVYAWPPGRSADIAQLLDSTGPIGASKHVKFNVTLVEDYAATWLDALTMEKMANNKGAFVEARKFEVDGILSQLGESTAHALYRSGTGAFGQLLAGSTITGTTFTLADRSTAKFMSVGMQIQFSATDGSALRDSGDFLTVTGVDEDAGTFTTATAGTNIAGLADTDFIYWRGDQLTAGSGLEKIRGLAAWLPLTAPTAGDNFYGADRSVHPTRLAGSRLNQPTVAAEDNILELAELIGERGGKPDKAFVSVKQFAKMAKRLNAKVEYSDAGGRASYGFAGIDVYTSAGAVRVHPDPDCPDNRGYLLQMDTWSLRHLKGLPHIVTDDGLRALRRTASDSIEIRARLYAQLLCTKPGANGVFSCQL